MRGAFITGTDTGVGKTRSTCLLLEWLDSQGQPALGLKPVSCGDREDAALLIEASSMSDQLELGTVNPVCYVSPVAPLVAARIEGQVVTTNDVAHFCREASQEQDNPFTLIEGVGGWEVPLADGARQADLVRALELPVILVVDNRLGALNHTILTVNAIRAAGLPILGIILNHIADSLDLAAVTNKSLIPELTDLPILAEILHGDPILTAEPELAEVLGI